MTADMMQEEESLNGPTKFQELGSALRERREQKSLEIEDIALRIKVSAKNLQAIEAGNPAGLPQPVFTRGFVRSYAQVLEMDLSEVEALLKEAFPEIMVNNINAERTTDAREQSVGINSPVVPKKFFAGLGLLILLGAIAAGVWLYLGGLDKLTGGSQTAPAGETSQISGEPASDGISPVDQADLSADENSGPAAGSGAGQADSAPATPPLAESAPPATAPPTTVASGQAPQASAPPATQPAQAGGQAESGTAVSSTVVRTSSNPPSGVHQVQISVVSGSSWIGIQADNTTNRNFELRTGSSYRLEFRQKATITLGNAAAVQVTYNGQRVPFTARDGEVKILRFPPAG